MHYVDGFTGGVILVKVLILYLKNRIHSPPKICVILAFPFFHAFLAFALENNPVVK